MKIVFYSPNFYPRIGGLENVVQDLAEAFVALGHEIVVLTHTPGEDADHFPFPVRRCPGLPAQIRAMRRADLVVQFNVSLKGILPWALSGRPLAVSHQTQNTPDWRGRLKNWTANYLASANIGCSRFIAEKFSSAAIIPNPYRHSLFSAITPWEERKQSVVFVGRLVSDKGVSLLLKALVRLREEGIDVPLTIAGAGPEEPRLREQVKNDGLTDQVVFAGPTTGKALVELINRHRIMVIPSLWEEPFGIVALEGLACGCIVLASNGGGLPEATGGLGVSFTRGDTGDLARQLRNVLQYPEHFRPHQEALDNHLKRCEKTAVARAYLDVFKRALRKKT